MAKVEIKKTSGGGGGGGNVSFTSVTYAQLVALIGSSGLVQGDSYLITDFQTIYDQPDFDINGNAQTIVPTLSGAIEPIIVEAVSTSEISNQAFSTVYENDLILYNWAFQGTEINATPAKGIITRRTTDYYNDGRRNSTPYDSRAVLFIRYETVSGSGIYNSYKNTGFASANVPTFGNNCTSNYIGNFWNTDINSYIMGYPFVLPNTVWGNNSSFNKVGDQAFNVTLGDFNCDNNNIGNYFYNNTIGAYFRNNKVQNYFNNNVADDNFENNNIGNYFTQNTSIGSYFRLNNIGNYFYFNISIDDYFQGNQIGNYFGTDITLDSGIGNTIDYNFASNVIGDFFNSNTVANDVENMNIEGYYQSHFIPATTNTKTWIGGLTTGFVNNTDGFLESKSYGLASQYVRADGQFANFPSTGGGGSSVNYYLNGSVNQGTFGGNTYYEMSKTPVIGAGTDFTINANGFIARFITDAGDPALLSIPSGNWNLEFFFSASSNGGSPSFYANFYKYDGATFTLIGSNSTAPEGITNGTTIDSYFTAVSIPTTSLNIGDRLAVDIYVTHSSRTITLHTEDNHLCEIITTFSTGINTLNGLSTQVQYFATGTSGTDFAISSVTDTHTFNLPTASATNTGKLSSSNWTTFNNKIDGSGTTNYVSKFTASGTIGDSVIQDNGTNIGINATPLSNIGVYVTPANTVAVGNRVNNIYTGASQAFGLIAATTGVSSGTANIGVFASAGNNPNANFGIQSQSSTASATANNVGGSFQAGNGLTNYALQLKDGTETLGRFLKCVTATNGYANWATLTVADTGLTLTTTGTSGAATLVGNTLNVPQYAVAVAFSPMPISVCDTAPTAATTQYYFQTISEVTGTISKVKMWGFSGTDLVLFGLYRGVLTGTMTLIGQGSATCTTGANEISLTAEIGQTLNLVVGENLVVGYYADGISWRTIYDVGISDTIFGITNATNITTMPATPTGTATSIRFACTLYS